MMESVNTKFAKVRNRSPRELRVRGAQEVAKFAERIFRFRMSELSDAQFLRQLVPRPDQPTALSAAAAIAERISGAGSPVASLSHGRFFPSLGRPEEIRCVLELRFSEQCRAIVDRATRAVSGRFDLLGLSNVTFGDPIDWRLEPISARRAPLTHWSSIDFLDASVAGDKKLIWELNRHQHFVTLGQAYWLTNDERFAAAFISQAESWMKDNPPNRGINWASSLEVAFRCISWIWALHLFARSAHMTPEFLLRLLKQLIAHGRHIETYLSYYFSPNTHLTGEALGLFYLGSALPEFKRAAKWRALGLSILTEQAPVHVGDDGVYFEQSSYYHRYTADFYSHLLILARVNGIELPAALKQKLAGLMDHLMWITRPDGTTPLIGDDDGGRLLALGKRDLDDFRDTLAVGAALFGRPDWKWVACQAPVELLWLLGTKGLACYDELPAEPATELSRAFDAAGYYSMRDGWSPESTFAVVDCGRHGSLSCGHAHADALAFDFSACGKNWLVDPGTFTYTGDRKLRDEFRGTAGHNTITVDGESQSEPAGPFSWKRVASARLVDFISGDGFVYFEGSHDGYHRLNDPVTHSRSLLFTSAENESHPDRRLQSYLVVRDSLLAQARHNYSIRYHIAPDCTAVANDNMIFIAEPGGRRLTITVFGSPNPVARISEGWCSRAYGSRDEALVASFEIEACGRQDFTTFILPAAQGQPVAVDQMQVDDQRARGFEIRRGAMHDFLLESDIEAGVVRCGSLAIEGSLGWSRFIDDRLVRACLIGGRRIEMANGFAVRANQSIRYCSMQRSDDRLEVRMSGAEQFEDDHAATILVNDTSFQIGQGWHSIAITGERAG